VSEPVLLVEPDDYFRFLAVAFHWLTFASDLAPHLRNAFSSFSIRSAWARSHFDFRPVKVLIVLRLIDFPRTLFALFV